MTVMGLLGAAAPGLWGGLRVAAPLWGAWEEGGAGGSLLRPHPAPLPPSRLIPKLRVPQGFPGGVSAVRGSALLVPPRQEGGAGGRVGMGSLGGTPGPAPLGGLEGPGWPPLTL